MTHVQEKDPAQQAIALLKNRFETFAASVEHDKITMGNGKIAIWNYDILSSTGIQIEQNGEIVIQADPAYTEIVTIVQNERKQNAIIKAEMNAQMLQAQKKRAQKDAEYQDRVEENNFIREEKIKDQVHDICFKLRQVASEEIASILKERIREGFERGHAPSKISDEYFALIELFEDKFHVDAQNSIFASMFTVEEFEGMVDSISAQKTQSSTNLP